MSLEKNILHSIRGVAERKVCIIGRMPDLFYTDLSEILTADDTVYIFDTIKNIQNIERINNNNYIKIERFAISNKKFDWYGWHLLQYCHKLKSLNTAPQLFTAVFYRGKHLFQYDMGVLPLVMSMIAEEGFLTIYNCSWSIAKSPTMKPDVNAETALHYTSEQIKIQHMQCLLDVFLNDSFVEQKNLSSIKTRVYRKIQSSSSIENSLYY